MTQPEYNKKKRECLLDCCNEHGYYITPDVEGIFGYAFDRAYVLGKQQNTEKSDVRKAKIRTTGKIIDVVKCTDYNNGTVYFLDNNNRDADPYDYRDLDFTYDEQDKLTETITQEEIEKASVEYADKTAKQYEVCNSEFVQEIMVAFEQGANYALGKQEKYAEEKTSALTDKEVYALESAISELESLIEGTLDEDYHKEQKSIINALKRIIKKYEKK